MVRALQVFSERLVGMMDTLIELADAAFPHFTWTATSR